MFKIPNREEIKEFIASIPNEKYRTVLYVGLFAGLRIKEIVCLRLQDLDFEQQLVYVNEEGAKYHRPRIVPMCSRLKEILLGYIEKHKYQFKDSYLFYPQHEDTRCVNHLSPMTMMVYFNVHFKKSRFYSHYKVAKNGNLMGNWSVHKLRHFYCSYLYEKGVDISKLAKLLGHKSPATTLGIYTHILYEKKLNKAVDKAFKDF